MNRKTNTHPAKRRREVTSKKDQLHKHEFEIVEVEVPLRDKGTLIVGKDTLLARVCKCGYSITFDLKERLVA